MGGDAGGLSGAATEVVAGGGQADETSVEAETERLRECEREWVGLCTGWLMFEGELLRPSLKASSYASITSAVSIDMR